MYISQPSSGEEGFMIAETTIKTGEVDLVVIDSDSSLIPKAVLTDGEIGDSSIGKKARLNSSAYPRLKAALVMNNVCVLVSSQYREKIGVMWGNPTTTQGGHALKYYADGIIEVSRVLTKEGEEIPGALVKIKVIKNKTFVPYKKGEFEIVFGKGIDFIKEIMTLGIEYEILKKAAGWYYFGEIRIERGESVVYKTLEDNPELLEEIREKIIEKIKGLTNEIKEEEISEDISSEV
jgi:recombination protein RecA